MERHKFIRQIVYNWVKTLPIDDQSGESIVTLFDIDRLTLQLEEVMTPCGTESRAFSQIPHPTRDI